MIEKLTHILANAKYLTLTLTDLGDSVQITATLRPKDGSDAAKPVQVKADYTVLSLTNYSNLTTVKPSTLSYLNGIRLLITQCFINVN